MSMLKQCQSFAACVYKVCSVPRKSYHTFNNGLLLQESLLSNRGINSIGLVKQVNTTSILNANVKSKEDEPILHITEACVKQLQKIAGSEQFLRLTVEGGGCSGFSYKFYLDKVINDDDVCFEKDGVRVISDNLSLELIKGSTVDYEVELIKSAFIVKDNPQSSSKCSCGVSFALD